MNHFEVTMSDEITFKDKSQFRKWLKDRDDTDGGVWIVFGKNKAVKTITANEALEVAICFGWIDGLIKKIDADTYKKYFSPRKKGSPWSDRNKAIVGKLIAAGLMEKRGMRAVERAKEDGTWDRPQKGTISDTHYEIFEKLIKSNKRAYANYARMPQSKRRQFVGFFFEAKREETKAKRIGELIELLEMNIGPMEKYSLNSKK